MPSQKRSSVKSAGTASTLARPKTVPGSTDGSARESGSIGAESDPGELLDRRARTWRWLEWVVPAFLCALLLAQALLSDGRLSQICDESTHLYAGYRYWKCGDFGYGSEHPPLPKLVAALPLLASGARRLLDQTE